MVADHRPAAVFVEALVRLIVDVIGRRPPDDPDRRLVFESRAPWKVIVDPGRGSLVLAIQRDVDRGYEIAEVVGIDPDDPAAFGRTARELVDEFLSGPSH